MESISANVNFSCINVLGTWLSFKKIWQFSADILEFTKINVVLIVGYGNLFWSMYLFFCKGCLFKTRNKFSLNSFTSLANNHFCVKFGECLCCNGDTDQRAFSNNFINLSGNGVFLWARLRAFFKPIFYNACHIYCNIFFAFCFCFLKTPIFGCFLLCFIVKIKPKKKKIETHYKVVKTKYKNWNHKPKNTLTLLFANVAPLNIHVIGSNSNNGPFPFPTNLLSSATRYNMFNICRTWVHLPERWVFQIIKKKNKQKLYHTHKCMTLKTHTRQRLFHEFYSIPNYLHGRKNRKWSYKHFETTKISQPTYETAFYPILSVIYTSPHPVLSFPGRHTQTDTQTYTGSNTHAHTLLHPKFDIPFKTVNTTQKTKTRKKNKQLPRNTHRYTQKYKA